MCPYLSANYVSDCPPNMAQVSVWPDNLQQSVQDDKKRVVIVKGGPGTGKSVVAVNLLAELTKENQFCQYVSKNSAPRNVYRKKLKGSIRKSSVDNMFKGSGIYTETDNNMIDISVGLK